ncbi:MAG: hypothetical protein WBC73_06485 [Phormidesmis sp.]
MMLLSLAAWNWSRQQDQQAADWVIHTAYEQTQASVFESVEKLTAHWDC